MDSINEIKISLMKKESEINIKENKASFIIKSSATFNVKEYLNEHIKEKVTGEEFINFISTSSKLMFDELISKNNGDVDNVGIWIKVGDEIYENSLTLELLNKIEEYGEEEVNGIFELIKMTLPLKEEEEEK